MILQAIACRLHKEPSKWIKKQAVSGYVANRGVPGVLGTNPPLANHNAARADASGPSCDPHLLDFHSKLNAASRVYLILGLVFVPTMTLSLRNLYPF